METSSDDFSSHSRLGILILVESGTANWQFDKIAGSIIACFEFALTGWDHMQGIV